MSDLHVPIHVPGATLHADECSIEEDALEFLLRTPEESTATGGRAVLEIGQVWGEVLLSVQHVSADSPRVLLGESPECSFYAPHDDLPTAPFPLFTFEDGRWVARLLPHWSGFVERGGARRALGSLVAAGALKAGADGLLSLPMDAETRLAVDLGASMFVARLARPELRVVTPWQRRLDTPLLATMAVVGMVAALLLLVIATTPPAMASDTVELPDQLVLLLQKPDPDPVQPKSKIEQKKDDEGARAKKAEGKVGKPDAKQKQAKGDKVAMRKKELDREVAENSGLLAALREGAAPDVFGSSALSSNLTNGIGGLIGARGTQIGSNGLAGRGAGLGGGGQANGIGGLGTHGKGGGEKGWGSESSGWGDPPTGTHISVPTEPTWIGNMDRSLIDAVIKRNMNQIRYCYQQQLTREHSLSGKVTVKFVIANDGSVSKAETKQTTMNNAAVESCINQRFMKFQFPQPKGNGIVIVSYPFMFSPG